MPLAHVVAAAPGRGFGIGRGDFTIPDDFDEPLAPEMLDSFAGGHDLPAVSLLPDTHVWLWWTFGVADRFPNHIRGRIESEPREVNVSMASRELALKASLGKVDFPSPRAAYALRQMTLQRFALLPITAEHIDSLYSLPQHHRDPFDRLLIAAARAERMTLFTADAAFAAYDIDAVIF